MSKLHLPDVTLMVIETRRHELTRLAVQSCLDKVEFGGVVIYSDNFNSLRVPGATYHLVPDWTDKISRLKFWWTGSWQVVKTSHTLNIEWDSWVWNPEQWTDRFLKYDYIGAPWSHQDQYGNVGNGGFSLISVELLKFLTQHQDKYPCNASADAILCRSYRPSIQAEADLSWAPPELAMQFAFERVRPSTTSPHFGFHGIFNWPFVLTDEELEERRALLDEYASTSGMTAQLEAMLKLKASGKIDKVWDKPNWLARWPTPEEEATVYAGDWIGETDTRYGQIKYPKNDIVLGTAVRSYGEWFESEADIFRAFVKEGDTVADVGANFGMHTLALASIVGTSGCVIAIEPQEALVKLLVENLRGKTTLKEYVAFAGEQPGKLLAIAPDYRQLGSYGSYNMLDHVKSDPTAQSSYVPAISFDDTLHWWTPTFLKIDVEGNELNVLKGAKLLIDRARPVLYIENDRPSSSPPLVKWLMERKYVLFWHIAPFYNPNNFKKNEDVLPIHALGYAFMHGQYWLNGVALMMLALPEERVPELVKNMPPGLIQVEKYNEHPCSDEASILMTGKLAGLGNLVLLHDERQGVVSQATKLAQQARKLAFDGDYEQAKTLFRSALELEHDNVNVWSHMGVLQGPGRYDATIACYTRALNLALRLENPAKALLLDLYQNLGTNYLRAERYNEVEPYYKKVLELRPEGKDLASLLHNWALLDYSLGHAGDAFDKITRSLELDPNDIGARNDQAHIVCKNGDLANGLKLMEVRWEMGDAFKKSTCWKLGLPIWKGEDLTGKTLLVHHEQGNGDTFQYVRYLDQIKAKSNARIVFAGPKGQRKLFLAQGWFDTFYVWDDVEDTVKASHDADFHIPLVSAVTMLEPTYDNVPTNKAYIKAPYKTEVDLRNGGAKCAVGLVWSPALDLDRGLQRVVPISQLMSLATIPGVRLWSLQVGLRTPDPVKFGCDIIMSDATVYINDMDWADTAALIEGLDAVVSVDTSTAHLAGAMGKRTFMIQPYVKCWRWCNGPQVWYDSMTDYDQRSPGEYNWREPIEDIRRDLALMMEEYA